MIPHDPATSLPILHVDRGDQIREVTLAFWVIMVAATTFGESGRPARPLRASA